MSATLVNHDPPASTFDCIVVITLVAVFVMAPAAVTGAAAAASSSAAAALPAPSTLPVSTELDVPPAAFTDSDIVPKGLPTNILRKLLLVLLPGLDFEWPDLRFN